MASLGVIARKFGLASLGIYLGSVVVCALMAGLATEWIYHLLNISPGAILGASADYLPDVAKDISAALLLGLVFYARWRRGKEKNNGCGCAQN